MRPSHIGWVLVGAGVVVLSGCTRDFRPQSIRMWNDSRLKPYEASPLPNEQSSSRLPPPGTIARDELAVDDPIRTGRSGGKLVSASPIPVTRALLERGQARFLISCSPCHGKLGDGVGIAVRRGFPHPPDYALRRLRRADVGHFYDVMTNGYGVMYSYAQSVSIHDRWAIAAYIRVLQASRPEILKDPYEDQRRRARLTGIADPGREERYTNPPTHETEPGGEPIPASPTTGVGVRPGGAH